MIINRKQEKTNNGKKQMNRKGQAWKRCLCMIIVFMLLLNVLPSQTLTGILHIDFPTIAFPTRVKAASESDIADIYDTSTHTVTIGSPTALVTYSQVYAANTADHSNDIIDIAFGSGNSTALMTGYIPIGNQTHPFKGTVKIAASSALNIFRLDVPFFGHVCDSASIIDSVSSSVTPLEVMVTSDDTKKPVLAYHVVHDSAHDWTEDSIHEWQVTKKVYVSALTEDNGKKYAYATAGFIGEMDQDAELIISVTDELGGDDLQTNNPNINGESDIGYICHVMNKDSKLTVKSVSGINNSYTISTSSGNAGGVVGVMKEGSVLTMQCNMIKTDAYVTATGSGKYAGGIVGRCDGGTISLDSSVFNYTDNEHNSRYIIGNVITGVAGSGGVAGYYRPHFTSGSSSFDVLLYDTTSARVEGPGNVGGIFGMLENKTIVNEADAAGGIITITDSKGKTTTINARHTVTDCTNYGGLIGLYQAYSLSESLLVTDVKSSAFTSTGYSWFGGGIGQVTSIATGDASYIKFSGTDFSVTGGNTLTTSDNRNYGGLLGHANNSFIDAANVKAANGAGFRGAGLIGRIVDGVVRLSGTTTLTGSLAEGSYHQGQLVGYRDDSIVFAEQGWTYNRMTACSADDIGSWGEIIRFKSTSSASNITSEKIEATGTAVLSINETLHTVTVSAHAVSGNETDGYSTSIGSLTDFANAALCFTIDASSAPAIIFEAGSSSYNVICKADITLTKSIDLSDTGFMGLTRDNDGADNASVTASKCVYYGQFDGGNYTVTLAIGEPFGKRGGSDLTDHSSNGNGRIYYHRYNGLFGILNRTYSSNSLNTEYSAKNVTFAGKAELSAKRAMYIGSLAGRVTKDFKAENVHSSTSFDCGGDSTAYLGRLIGECEGGITSINVSGTSKNSPSIFSGNISGSNTNSDSCIGGVIGIISHESNKTETWSFNYITLRGNISNSDSKNRQQLGGLIAVIKRYDWNNNGAVFNSRKLNLNGIITDGLTIQGKTEKYKQNAESNLYYGSMGGLLGYSWLNTDVNVIDVDISNSSKVTLISTEAKSDFAGLVYAATGKWTVTDLDIYSIVVETSDGNAGAGDARSFGMIVNKGFYSNPTVAGSSAIYMLLPEIESYRVTSSTFNNMPTPGVNFDYDEIVTYSAYYRSSTTDDHIHVTLADDTDLYLLRNGNGVISIKTSQASGLVMDETNPSLSYAAQTSLGKYPNPHSRYYYNLDTVTSSDASTLTTPQTKLMTWSLAVYAHRCIKNNFDSPFTNNTIPDYAYDMTGYSWYPVDIESSRDYSASGFFTSNTVGETTTYTWHDVDGLTVNGAFTFANKEFELSEKAKYDAATSTECDRTSLYYSSDFSNTQHFLLHESLFRNVRKTLNIGTLSLAGNVGAVVESGSTALYSGALVCGKVEGEDADKLAKVDMSSGSVSLAGIQVHNLSAATGTYGKVSSDYAPLLINNGGEYISLVIKNISNTSDYNSDSNTAYAGTSLIGNVGFSTANGINVNFSNIKLDARGTSLISDTTLSEAGVGKGNFNAMYNSKHALFTKATLLHKLSFASGSGVYNYTWNADWDSDGNGIADTTHNGNVTYGLELWDGSENATNITNSDTGRTQYIGQEHCYSGSTTYTSPISSSASAPYNFAGFLPYVYTVYSSDNAYYQLEVNHAVIDLDGCGTYNDPYVFSSGTKLMTVAGWINGGSFAGTQEICIPNGVTNFSIKNTEWCGNDHKTYVSDGTTFKNVADSNDTISFENMRIYLAGAYYIVDADSNVTSVTSITVEQGFVGFGNTNTVANRFRGVIDGNNKTIINETGYPLIYYSNGSVVRDLNISVIGNVDLYGAGTKNNNEDHSFNKAATIVSSSTTSGTKVTTTTTNSGGNEAYGAVIGRIMGGDNIIDNVRLTLGSEDSEINIGIHGTGEKVEVNTSNNSTTIKTYGSYAQLVPVGGYVGVVVNGGLVFRNMSQSNTYNETLFNNVNFKAIANNATDTAPMSDSNNEWLYVNPIVGRVIGGYVINESTDNKYRPYENGTRVYTVGTAAETETWSDGKVTLENGKKHYSIAELDATSAGGKLQVTSGRAISVPDGQSLFILSLIVNSGIGIKKAVFNDGSKEVTAPDLGTVAVTGFYGDYYTVRNATYENVGCGKSASSDSYPDFTNNAAIDNYYINLNNYEKQYQYNPYLIKKYTQKTTDTIKYKDGSTANIVVTEDVFYAGIIAYNTNSSTISMTASESVYTLPDGFKGINRILRNGVTDSKNVNTSSILYVTSIDGNGNTISQNTSYVYYQTGGSEYDNFYNPYSNESLAGLGLFNCYAAPNNSNVTIKKIKLKGRVECRLRESNSNNGAEVSYIKGNVDGKAYVCSVGMLYGTNYVARSNANYKYTIDSLALNNAYIFGPKYTGGLIGFNNVLLKIDITNTEGYDSSDIRVHSGGSAGGMIGRTASSNFNLTLNYNNKHFDIIEVVSDCVSGVNSDYYNYGVGGLIGVLRATGSESAALNISGVKIGNNNQTTLSSVKSQTANLYAGGMIGIINRAWLKMNDCEVNNVEVKSPLASGGLIGHWATSGGQNWTRNTDINNNRQSEIKNVHIACTISDVVPSIESTGSTIFSSAGGFLASGKEDLFDTYFTDCSIKGYNISGHVAAGGMVGIWGDTSTKGGSGYDQHALVLDNVEVSNCSISSDGSDVINTINTKSYTILEGSAGGLVGKLNNGTSQQVSKDLSGGSSGNGKTYGNYYVYGYNILTRNVDLTATRKGGIVGTNANTQQNCIMIAGFSRQDGRDTPNMTQPMVGASFNCTSYLYPDDNKDPETKSGGIYTSPEEYNYYGTKLIYDNTPGVEANVQFPGYVVCADYDGRSIITIDPESETPIIRRKTEWSTVTGPNLNNVTIGEPYVTSSGYANIDDNGTQFLTADGVDYDGSSVTYANSAIGSIMGDLIRYDTSGGTTTVTPRTSEPKRYAYAYNSIETSKQGSAQTMYEKLALGRKYSTYKTELSNFAGPKNDFPVLVIDDINATNTTEFINNYIRYLTNTDFNYARNSMYNDDSSTYDGTASGVYNIEIGTCQWNAGTGSAGGSFTYSTSDPNLLQSSGLFRMKSGSYDNAGSTGQFTLIDVQYLDPADTTKVAFHLYIPVIVEKVMRYDFRATFLTGTTYVKQPYFNEWNDATGGNSLVENIGNPITLEMHYTYQKSLSEWQSMFASGESLLYTYPKKMQVIDATGLGLPSDTRMVLVDPNDGNRVFYGGTSVYQSGTNNYLNLNLFKTNSDGTGGTFESVLMNDFFNVSVTEASGTGKYDKVILPAGIDKTVANYVSAHAIIRNGEDYYKYNEDGEGAYNISISYKDGAWDSNPESDGYGYIVEDYYISFFTKQNDDNFYHLEFYDPGTFNYSAYPSVIDVNYHSHLLTGKIFTNTFTITETNATQKMSLESESLNDYIGAYMTANIGVVDDIRPTVRPYLGYESVRVYQSFLLSLNKQNSASDQQRGIQVKPKISISSFTINSEADIKDSITVIPTANYIEFRDNVDLSTRLRATCDPTNLEYGHDVEVKTTVILKYDNNDALVAQFPQRDTSEENNISSVVGTKMLGSSQLSSSATSAAYSKTADEKYGSLGRLYFRTTSSNATLTLNSDDAENENGEFYQLGINANDMDSEDAVNGYVPMKMRAIYDVSKVAAAENAESMKIVITVRRKDDYTDTGLKPINEYITDLVIGDKNYSTDPEYSSTVVRNSSASSVSSYVYYINNPDQVLTYVDEDNKRYYEMPLTMNVFTGSGDTFEGDSDPAEKYYANYMIDMKAELYYKPNCESYIEGTTDNDHVIWTNAKLLTEIVNPGDANP